MRWCTQRLRRSGFTLSELLVTLAVVLVFLTFVLSVLTAIDRGWKTAAADPYAEASDAFDSIARQLSGATLEPYSDFANAAGAFRADTNFIPDHPARRSDLAFACGPAAGASGLLSTSGITTTGDAVFFVEPAGYSQTLAHQGAGHLLNAMGYYMEFGDDTVAPGFVSAHAWRWRLKQVQQPSEALQIFATTTSADWIAKALPAGTTVPVLAENIITLIVLPERAIGDTGAALAPNFSYDSRDISQAATLHQLPPRVRLALVAIDAAAALRLAQANGAMPPAVVPAALFQQAGQLDTDLATLDQNLTAAKIGHRIFERDISLTAAAWSNTP